MKSDIDVDHGEDGLVWLTINRPEKHNALALPVLSALADAVREWGARGSSKVLIVRGAGDRYFAAGGDLVELNAVRSHAQINAMADDATRALDAVRHCAVPVVAFLNGDAIGGGAELAVACDFRVVTPQARIGFVQGRLGITSAWGGGPDLFALLGPARAARMMACCELVGSKQALEWGLADIEVTDGAPGEQLTGFLRPILERTRSVLEGIKQQAIGWRDGDRLTERRAVERQHLLRTWSSDEHWQAVERFMSRGR